VPLLKRRPDRCKDVCPKACRNTSRPSLNLWQVKRKACMQCQALYGLLNASMRCRNVELPKMP
ncbi:unnamed protein product, partial [Tetraodon nigroviridis]